ncbi:SNARE complex subunit [Rhizophagus clarus]|uniref:SNARE complex subunit n=1 Tax=Rhizophagus clarus TaxID=94130 RepID=A0A8H3R539_9GLOM|nr:SNARE complex subunit [Rhizophagus clarus]
MEKSSKLSILADNTLASIYERNRCRAEDIEYPHEETLNKNMERLRSGIKELEEELSAAEESGTLNSKELKEKEDTLIKLTKQIDKLEALMQDKPSARKLLLGLNNIMDEPSSKKSKKTVRFSDQTDDYDNAVVIQLQQRMIQNQDEDLDRLSAAIGRQQELGLMIGEELNYQVELLAETEDIVDRTEGRLNKAKRNLTKVSKKAKEKGSIWNKIPW